jgi:hypothetical protein
MSESYTEASTKSWTTRIGESIKGFLIGLVLIIGSCIFLFWNEGRAVQTQRSLMEGAGLVVTVPPTSIDTANNEGRLVHVTGDIKPGSPLNDPDFNVASTALRLVRTVEMYQWKEDQRTETRRNVGGSEETVTTYEYSRTWHEGRLDSSRFKRPEGHNNPQMRYRSAAYTSRDATLGAFRPGSDVIERLPANDIVPLDSSLAKLLQGRFGGSVHIADGHIYLAENPSSSRVGDLRVSYRVAPGGPTSIIARQVGSGFGEYQTKAGDRLLMVRPGTLTAAEMFADAQSENRVLTWILRVAGIVAMFFGFFLVLNPLVVVADVVPFIGSILGAGAGLVSMALTAVLAPVVIAIAWLWYRPLVSIGVLAVGLGLAYLFKRRAGQKTAARTAQPAAT